MFLVFFIYSVSCVVLRAVLSYVEPVEYVESEDGRGL